MCGTRHAHSPETVRRFDKAKPYNFTLSRVLSRPVSAGRGLPAIPMQLSRRAGVHARRNTLRSTLLSPSLQSTGTVAPQKRPQSSSAHRLALRPRWPRAKAAQRRATVPGRRKTCGQDGSATICPKARRVGRARSPLRAALVCADPASGLNLVFRALTSAATFNISVH